MKAAEEEHELDSETQQRTISIIGALKALFKFWKWLTK